jgi:hypothetical protein
MPTYDYEPVDPAQACDYCAGGFSRTEPMTASRLTTCPQCGATIRHVFNTPGIGPSATSLDRQAKDAGFHKLKRLGKGEYEKQY